MINCVLNKGEGAHGGPSQGKNNTNGGSSWRPLAREKQHEWRELMAAPRKGKTTRMEGAHGGPSQGKNNTNGGSSWRPLAREKQHEWRELMAAPRKGKTTRGPAGHPESPFRKALSLTEFLEAEAASNRLLRAVCGVLSAVCATLEM